MATASQTFTTSQYWQCPAGVTQVTVECWGQGDYGDSGHPASLSGGKGGGGGAYALTNAILEPGGKYAALPNSGSAGSPAIFQKDGGSPLCSAEGAIGKSGIGGKAVNCIGDTKVDGGDGGAGGTGGGGGGGGCGGSTGSPGGASAGGAGGAGANGGGTGGTGGAASHDGNYGANPGSGQGGYGQFNTTTSTGPQNGQVKVTWTVPINMSVCSVSN